MHHLQNLVFLQEFSSIAHCAILENTRQQFMQLSLQHREGFRNYSWLLPSTHYPVPGHKNTRHKREDIKILFADKYFIFLCFLFPLVHQSVFLLLLYSLNSFFNLVFLSFSFSSNLQLISYLNQQSSCFYYMLSLFFLISILFYLRQLNFSLNFSLKFSQMRKLFCYHLIG